MTPADGSKLDQLVTFDKADWSGFNELFKLMPWDCVFVSNDMNEVWNAWVDLFDNAVDQCTPKKNKDTRGQRTSAKRPYVANTT